MQLVSNAQGQVIADATAVSLPENAAFNLALPIFNRADLTGILSFTL